MRGAGATITKCLSLPSAARQCPARWPGDSPYQTCPANFPPDPSNSGVAGRAGAGGGGTSALRGIRLARTLGRPECPRPEAGDFLGAPGVPRVDRARDFPLLEEGQEVLCRDASQDPVASKVLSRPLACAVLASPSPSPLGSCALVRSHFVNKTFARSAVTAGVPSA